MLISVTWNVFGRTPDVFGSAVDKMHTLLGDLLELSRIGRLINPSGVIPFEELANNALELAHGQLVSLCVTALSRTCQLFMEIPSA